MKLENTPEIHTKRLILRKFTKDDIQSFFEIMSDEVTNRFLPWFPTKTIAEAENLLKEQHLKTYENKQGYHYAVCLKEDNRPIGYVNLSDNESHDFGYGLKPEFWGKGIIAEAATAILEKIKSAGYPYITATHDINNPQSGRVMQKLSMKYCYSYVEQCQPKDVKVTFRMYQLNLDENHTDIYMEYYNKYENHFIEENIV